MKRRKSNRKPWRQRPKVPEFRSEVMALTWRNILGHRLYERSTYKFQSLLEPNQGELYKPAKVDDCYWSIEDQNAISVLLTKHDPLDWWKCLVKGDTEIDTQKVEPENSKLSDLDPETRQTVEKMMIGCVHSSFLLRIGVNYVSLTATTPFFPHISLGLPTSDEKQKRELLKKFTAEHPEMDLSRAKISGMGTGQYAEFSLP